MVSMGKRGSLAVFLRGISSLGRHRQEEFWTPRGILDTQNPIRLETEQGAAVKANRIKGDDAMAAVEASGENQAPHADAALIAGIARSHRLAAHLWERVQLASFRCK
jgi:hypothetical protein